MKNFLFKCFYLGILSLLLIHANCNEPIDLNQQSGAFVGDPKKPILAQLNEVAQHNSKTLITYKEKISSAREFSRTNGVSFTGAQLEELEKKVIKALEEAIIEFSQAIKTLQTFLVDHTQEANLSPQIQSMQQNLGDINCSSLALPSLDQIDEEFHIEGDSIESLLKKKESFQNDFTSRLNNITQILFDELSILKGIPTKAQEEERKRQEAEEKKEKIIKKTYEKEIQNLKDRFEVTQDEKDKEILRLQIKNKEEAEKAREILSKTKKLAQFKDELFQLVIKIKEDTSGAHIFLREGDRYIDQIKHVDQEYKKKLLMQIKCVDNLCRGRIYEVYNNIPKAIEKEKEIHVLENELGIPNSSWNYKYNEEECKGKEANLKRHYSIF